MKVYKCDICGKTEPRSIRNIIVKNPDVDENSKINNYEYYAFNLFYGDFCEDCLYELERFISIKVDEMKREKGKQI